jgi:hypothetical protein
MLEHRCLRTARRTREDAATGSIRWVVLDPLGGDVTSGAFDPLVARVSHVGEGIARDAPDLTK